MTIPLRTKLWTILLQKRFAEKPQLVVDWLDAQNKQWTSYGPSNPYSDQYATPLLYNAIAGPDYEDKKRLYEAAALGLTTFGGPKGAIAAGGAFLAIDIYRKSVETDRAKLGKEIWERDPKGVMALAANFPAWEQAMGEIIANNPDTLGSDHKLAEAAKANLEAFNNVLKDAGIPYSSASIELIGASLGVDFEALGFKQATEAARRSLPADANEDAVEARVATLMRGAWGEASISDLASRLKERLDKQVEQDRALADDEAFRRGLAEFKGFGQLLGTVISLGGDTRRGALVSSLFENASNLYASYKALSAAGAAFSVATFASGFGASLAICSIIGQFGSSEAGTGATQQLLDAIRGLYGRLDDLSKKIDDLGATLHREFGDLNFNLGINFSNVHQDLNLVLARITILSRLLENITREQSLDDITQQRIVVQSTPSDATISNALISYYSTGTIKSNNAVWTGAGKSEGTIAAELRAEPDLFVVERYPDVLWRIHQYLTNWRADNFARGAVPTWLVDFPLERLSLAHGLPGDLVEDIQDATSISPRLTGLAADAFADCYRLAYLRPKLRPVSGANGETDFARRLTYMEALLSWPRRVCQLLGTRSALEFALNAYFESTIALLRIPLGAPTSRADATLSQTARVAFLLGAMASYDDKGNREFDFTRLVGEEVPDQAPDIWMSEHRYEAYSNEWMLLPNSRSLFPLSYTTPPHVQAILEFIRQLSMWRLTTKLRTIEERTQTPVSYRYFQAKYNGLGPAVPAEPSPTLYGIGPFFGMYAIDLVAATENGLNTPIAAFSIVDSRTFEDVHQGLQVPECRKDSFTVWAPADLTLRSVCPGPYDEVGYLALTNFLDEICEAGLSGDALYAKFLKLRSDLSLQKISLTLVIAPDIDDLSDMMRQIQNSRREHIIGQTAVSFRSIQDRWLDLLTVTACYCNETGNIEPLLRMQRSCADSLVKEDKFSLIGAADWDLLTGGSIGSLLSLWTGRRIRQDRSRTYDQQIVVLGANAPEVPERLRDADLLLISVKPDGAVTIPLNQFDLPAPQGPAFPLFPFTDAALGTIAQVRGLVDSFVHHR